MRVESRRIGETLKSAFSLFRSALPRLASNVLPLIVVGELLSYSAESFRSLTSLALEGVSWLVLAWAAASSLWLMLQLRRSVALAPLSFAQFALFTLVFGYVTVATTLGLLLFIVPALFVMATTMLAPAFAITRNQGPFESVASSAISVNGNILRVAVMVTLIWLALLVVGVVAVVVSQIVGLASRPIAFVGSVALGFCSLYFYAVVVVMFDRLHPNPSINTDAAR